MESRVEFTGRDFIVTFCLTGVKTEYGSVPVPVTC